MKEQKNTAAAFNIALFVLLFAAVTYLTIKYTSMVTNLIRKPEEFRELLLSYGSASVLVYMFFQVMQVIIVLIPGELVQIAGGYVYGTFLGTVYSVIGAVAGMAIVFFVTRLLGYKVIKMFLPQKSIDKFEFLINSRRTEILIFVLFLIPGIPKDALTYISGLTPIKPFQFLFIASLARIPGILGCSIIGSNLQKENYTVMIIVSIIACVLFIAGILLKDKIVNKVHEFSKNH